MVEVSGVEEPQEELPPQRCSFRVTGVKDLKVSSILVPWPSIPQISTG